MALTDDDGFLWKGLKPLRPSRTLGRGFRSRPFHLRFHDSIFKDRTYRCGGRCHHDDGGYSLVFGMPISLFSMPPTPSPGGILPHGVPFVDIRPKAGSVRRGGNPDRAHPGETPPSAIQNADLPVPHVIPLPIRQKPLLLQCNCEGRGRFATAFPVHKEGVKVECGATSQHALIIEP
jgi:hypothetical protein